MIGRTISHYRILEQLGAGGMGVVYKAEDTRLGRMVALKVLSEALLRDPGALERFRREARAASALNHPNICTIHEVDEVDGTPFLVMELLEGQTLREVGRLDADKLVDLATEFADALAAAHQAHIIHRDLKPANLFLTNLGHLKILDFGLATVVTDDSKTAVRDLTETGTTVGTIAYMSPEQARGEAVDARTDLFSFGAVLYELVTGRRAFAGPTQAGIYDAILHRDAPPAGGPLEPIINKALQKDRDLRYQSAADIRADLKRLKHDSGVAGTAPRRPIAWIALAALGVMAVVAGWLARPRPKATPSRQTTVAVLPFANLGGNRDRDYLRLALPDELITILSHSPALAVRPFAMTRKFVGDVDPQQTGRNLSVAQVITGHFRDAGGRLGITLEAIDVEKNDVLWRDSLDVPAEDLIAMRNELSNRIRVGLLPLLDATHQARDDRPHNDEAYTLFMRASALSNDPVPNKQGVVMLERAVALDPTYAPAWAALSARQYYDSEYADGGDAARVRALESARRALKADPDLVDASKRMIIMHVEDGQTEDAYLQARDLLRRRPDNADAHFTLSYVVRYAGLLDETMRECEIARSLDPTNAGFRSCALTFIQAGDIARARQFLNLDRGSVWSRNVEMYIFMREGRRDDALQRAADGSNVGASRAPGMNDLAMAILRRGPQTEIDRLASRTRDSILQLGDAEPSYFTATFLANCGRQKEALDLLRSLAPRNYCAFPAVDLEPAFTPIRKTPEFQQVRSDAIQCQQRFMRWRAQNAP